MTASQGVPILLDTLRVSSQINATGPHIVKAMRPKMMPVRTVSILERPALHVQPEVKLRLRHDGEGVWVVCGRKVGATLPPMEMTPDP
jgi:hypothetical protein